MGRTVNLRAVQMLLRVDKTRIKAHILLMLGLTEISGL